MLNAASLDLGWDFWILALLVALLFTGAMPAGSGVKPPRGKALFGARLAAEGAR